MQQDHLTVGDLVTNKDLQNKAANAFVKQKTSKEKRLSLDELVRESLKHQPEMLQAYPTMPKIEMGEIETIQDYAYSLHDQAIFLRDAVETMR